MARKWQSAERALELHRQVIENLAPQVGLEPTTLRLTAECSTIELLRSKAGQFTPSYTILLRQNCPMQDDHETGWDSNAG